MKQNSTGSIVVTGAGEGLTDAAKGPLTDGPVCTDWREKAFELARDLNEKDEVLAMRDQSIEDLNRELRETKHTVLLWRSFAFLGWVCAAVFALRSGWFE
jgi:hypothetical protein